MTAEDFFKRHTRLTRSLKKFVMDHEGTLAPETFGQFLEMLSSNLQQSAQDFQSLPAGALRARHLQSQVDVEIAGEGAIEVSCKKGCSACCHMEVEVTTYEAAILHKIIADGKVIDRERLQRQSLRTVGDDLWKKGPRLLENRCVFLNDEGACGIYENRPVMCRRHSVTTPAKNCETLDATITIRYFPRVDLLISAANEDQNMQIGPMAKMLQMELQMELLK